MFKKQLRCGCHAPQQVKVLACKPCDWIVVPNLCDGRSSLPNSTIKTIWEVIRTTDSIGFPNIMNHSINYFPNLCFIRSPPLSNIKKCPRQNSSIKSWVGFHGCPLMDRGHQLKSLTRAGVEVWRLTPMFPARWRLRKETGAVPRDYLKT